MASKRPISPNAMLSLVLKADINEASPVLIDQTMKKYYIMPHSFWFNGYKAEDNARAAHHYPLLNN